MQQKTKTIKTMSSKKSNFKEYMKEYIEDAKLALDQEIIDNFEGTETKNQGKIKKALEQMETLLKIY